MKNNLTLILCGLLITTAIVFILIPPMMEIGNNYDCPSDELIHESFESEGFIATWTEETTMTEEATILVSDLYIPQPPVESEIIPGMMVESRPKFRCPVGDEVLDSEPAHGEIYACGGYRFVNYGNSVYLIREIQ